MGQLRQVGRQRRVIAEERRAVAINLVGLPARIEYTLPNQVIEIDQAVEVNLGIVAKGEMRSEKRRIREPNCDDQDRERS